jgi:hypothetical protein
MYIGATQKAENADAEARRHFDDWQALIDKNNAAMSTRQADLEKREREFNVRVKTFEDVVSISAIFANTQSDPRRLRDVLTNAGVINQNDSKR